MIFTDGQSNEPSKTATEARALQNSGLISNWRSDDVIIDLIINRFWRPSKANVFAFGIGTGIKYDELNSIASKPENVGQMQNFDQIEDFLRNDFKSFASKF